MKNLKTIKTIAGKMVTFKKKDGNVVTGKVVYIRNVGKEKSVDIQFTGKAGISYNHPRASILEVH